MVVLGTGALVVFSADVGTNLPAGDIIAVRGKSALGARFLNGYWLALAASLVGAAFAGAKKEERWLKGS